MVVMVLPGADFCNVVVRQAADRYTGFSINNISVESKVVIDFSHPNIAKPINNISVESKVQIVIAV